MTLRYGENPHQQAAFYTDPRAIGASVTQAKQIQGRELSFNNIADADTALECVRQFDTAGCVIVKHANPCGAARCSSIADAYALAYRTDPTSAYGGIIAFNRELDAATARAIIDQQFVEVILAPSVAEEAKSILSARDNVRVLITGDLSLPGDAVAGIQKRGGRPVGANARYRERAGPGTAHRHAAPSYAGGTR